MSAMMTSAQIRQTFLDFFKSKGHVIVPSAPIVIKNDPTLLFTNAGMNQFKDYFLGNKKPQHSRVADTQKCLRVSGKHNDLEEVGVDTYHHTMFEMLGNWSFGDPARPAGGYFKKEAIEWSWELLTKVYQLDADRLYVTIFEGDEKEGLPRDDESFNEWKKHTNEDRILLGNKKDNFWEMGDTGPCGPCTEIHYDCRDDVERKKVDGKTLVNNDDPQVIEIWNNVFIQYNRLKDGSLQPLPAKHVDTGMGFERLVRVLQGKQSNYDTDVFSGTIIEIEKTTGKKYSSSLLESSPSFGGSWREAVAFRVLADHIRAISFTIADGQLPSNTGSGYVIRRILRRAVRYYYSYLDYKQPLLFQLLPVIAKQFENVFPELIKQQDFVSKVIKEEEEAFLRTISKGIDALYAVIRNKSTIINAKVKVALSNKQKNPKIQASISTELFSFNHSIIKNNYNVNEEEFNKLIENIINENMVEGNIVFELYDTYGFPLDLTKLIAQENRLLIDEAGFEVEMQKQKSRSKAATAIETEDWINVHEHTITEFVGYDSLEVKTKIVKYRKVKAKGKEQYQIVLAATPFYAESGGQVGDTGLIATLSTSGEGLGVRVLDTKKENDLIIHFTDTLPADLSADIIAKVDAPKRRETAIHHSATHLLHAALRKVLGTHVTQKGSLVNEEHLRFDFSHFAKITDEEIFQIESIVNEKIRENIPVVIKEMSKDEAVKLGAMALFGEKYGDRVRVVIMDTNYSIELCGGTHVGHTGELGLFKIKHETAIAAGVRRIEAVSGKAAEDYINEQLKQLKDAKHYFNNPKDLNKSIENTLEELSELKSLTNILEAKVVNHEADKLLSAGVNKINSILFVGCPLVLIHNDSALKRLCLEILNHKTIFPEKQFGEDIIGTVVILCTRIDGKAYVVLGIDNILVSTKNLDANKIIKEHIAPLIKGGGGGQKTLATAGGQDASNLQAVISKVQSLL